MARANPWDVVVIGAGMAGLSTAIWSVRLGLTTLVLEGEPMPGGQLSAIGGKIVDFPGLDLPGGRDLAERLLRQARERGATVSLESRVEGVDGANLTCYTQAGPASARALVIATGLAPRRLNVPGEEALYQAGLVRRPSHEPGWFRGREAVVIGGGDRAAENALILAGQASRVTLLHRADRLRARPAFAEPLLKEPRIDVKLNTQVERFEVRKGRVKLHLATGRGPLSLSAEAVCIYIGNRPSTHLVAEQVALDPEGYIVTDRFGKTSLPGVYAAGDVCTPPDFQSLSTAAGQAMVVAKGIALERARRT